MKFGLIPYRLGDVVPHLKARAPKLAGSLPDDLPTIALSAFAHSLAEQSDVSTPADGMALIAELLAWRSSEVTEAVEDGFFARLKDNPHIEAVLVRAMSADLRDAYTTWTQRDDGG